MNKKTLLDLMGDYFEEMIEPNSPNVSAIFSAELISENNSIESLPVKTRAFDWNQAKEFNALIRKFEFKNYLERNNFINEILQLEISNKANIDFSVSDYTVTVKINTKGIEVVTQANIDLAETLDHIERDIKESNYL